MPEPNSFHAGSVHSVASREKYTAIAELIRKAMVGSQVSDLGRFEECVINRERVRSTGLGRGVAVAHGKTALVDRVIVSLGISRHGIEFESPDGAPVHLLFLVASPPARDSEYLITLSTIASLFRREGLKERLLSSSRRVAARVAAESFGEAFHSRLAGRLEVSGLL